MQAAEKPAGRAAPKQDGAIRSRQQKGETAAHRSRALGRAPRQLLGKSGKMRLTGRPPWTDQTGGTSWPAHHRAEVHERLGQLSRPMGAGETSGQIAQLAGGIGQSGLDPMQARHDPQRVAVDRNARRAVDDRPQRARGVGPDARQGAQRRFVAWQLAAMALDDGPGAGVQRAGAAVVAKPLPGMQNLAYVRGGKRMEVGKARQENRETGS